MIPKLRPYQQQALEAERRHRAECPDETRLAIVLATGLGKGTIIAERAVSHQEAERARDYQDALMNRLPRNESGAMLPQARRVLILAHTDEIVTDLAARCALRADGNFSVGIVKAEQDECTADIVVASVQTLANPSRRERIRDVGLVIVDECHHSVASSYESILRWFGCMDECICVPVPDPITAEPLHAYECFCPATPALGFTATLERGDGASLGHIWQDVVFTRDISWGVRHGYLVQPIGHRLEIASRLTSVHGNEFTPGVQDDLLIDALAPEKIVEKWIELAAGLCEECRDAVAALDQPTMPSYCPNRCLGQTRQTVAFMPLVRSAIALADAFTLAGISATWISGNLPDIETRLRVSEFKRGTYQVLVNAMILTEGFDHPPISCVIVGRPTKSRPLFIQMAGRGLRPVPGIPVEEQDCILITVADATTDLCTVADLSDRPLDRKMQGALTVMEDQWDIGQGIEDEQNFWVGKVDVTQFDPLVTRSSKAWNRTKRGTPFLVISKDREYVFLVNNSVFLYSAPNVKRLHHNLPDLDLAVQVAEDEAQERGGDLGRLLADKGRAWRKAVPSAELQEYARRMGLEKELSRILAERAGGKAGRLSDLITTVQATRRLEPVVEKIIERGGA